MCECGGGGGRGVSFGLRQGGDGGGVLNLGRRGAWGWNVKCWT